MDQLALGRDTRALRADNRFVRSRKLGVWEHIFDSIAAANDGNLLMLDSASLQSRRRAANGRKEGA